MNYKLKKMVLSGVTLCLTIPHVSLALNIPPLSTNQKRILIAATTAAVAGGVYYKYGNALLNKIKNYKNSFITSIKDTAQDKIEDEIVNSLMLAVTPNMFIAGLPKEEKEKLFRKKAQLINARIRILAKSVCSMKILFL